MARLRAVDGTAGRDNVGGERFQRLDERADERVQDLLFGGEVVIHRALGHADALGDVSDGGARIAAGDEEFPGRGEDLLARGVGAAANGARHALIISSRRTHRVAQRGDSTAAAATRR
jgi:hypothetical protein